MGDSRVPFSPSGMPTNPANASWMALAAALNLQYAKRHGYNFEFLQYKGDCILDLKHTKVKRHPAWCKLLAIQHASLRQSDAVVVYIDSDAVFANQSETLDHRLQRSTLYLPGVNPLVNSSVPVTLLQDDCSVYFFKDKYREFNENPPSKDFANTGVHIWPQPFNWNLLSEWWKTNVSADHRQWEQDALNNVILRRHPREVCVIDNACTCCQSSAEYVWHHNRCYQKPENNVIAALTKDMYFPAAFQALSNSSFQGLIQELADHIVDLPQDALDALATSLS